MLKYYVSAVFDFEILNNTKYKFISNRNYNNQY